MIKHILLCVWVIVAWHGYALAQIPCNTSVKGHIHDADLQKPIVGAQVHVLGFPITQISSRDGYFELNDLCNGELTLRIEYPGYKLFQETYTLPLKVPVEIYLHPLSSHLQTITILGQRQDALVEPARKVSAEELFRSRGQTLGKALESLPGLYNLSTGQSISKPIVHGLHSNRVLIVNNDLRQESQQWGAEHAPEVDAFQSTELQLITGPRCLRYGSDALGGVILMQTDPLHLVTQAGWMANTGLFSNGRGTAWSIMGESPWKKNKAWVGRIQGSIRRFGNLNTPDYVLDNTGLYERSYSLGLGYKKNRWTFQWNLSQFYTRLGILSTSHIGNLSDLYAAFLREHPLDTPRFTYRIGFPYQALKHQTFQWQGVYKLNNKQKLEWQYAIQRNRRKEFDKTLQTQQNNGEVLPALDFNLTTHQVDFRWINQAKEFYASHVGLSSQIQTNEYYAAYLIPNYIRFQNGVYSLNQYTKGKITAELGIRYDVQSLQVVRWEQGQLNEHQFLFHGPAVLAGLKLLTPKTNYYLYGGSTWRAPHVNELYSYGIHHSAATFEIGDSTLKPERNYQINLSTHRGKSDRFHWTTTLYAQYIDQFIYLKPVFPATLTIKGAFPTFQYTPIQLMMSGFDFLLESPRQQKWPWFIKSAMLIARDMTTGFAPVGMPPARLEGELARKIKLPSHDPIRVYAGLGYTFKANGFEEGSDYTKPPKAFLLCRTGIETGFHWQNVEGRIALGVNNLLNVRYRDYLNRYRYFAHEPGRNVFVQCSIGRH